MNFNNRLRVLLLDATVIEAVVDLRVLRLRNKVSLFFIKDWLRRYIANSERSVHGLLCWKKASNWRTAFATSRMETALSDPRFRSLMADSTQGSAIRSSVCEAHRASFKVNNRTAHLTCFLFLAEWFWKCLAKQWLLKFVAVLMIMVAVMVVWSECTFFVVKPVLSIFANFVTLAAAHKQYFHVEVSTSGFIPMLVNWIIVWSVSYCISYISGFCSGCIVFHHRIPCSLHLPHCIQNSRIQLLPCRTSASNGWEHLDILRRVCLTQHSELI